MGTNNLTAEQEARRRAVAEKRIAMRAAGAKQAEALMDSFLTGPAGEGYRLVSGVRFGELEFKNNFDTVFAADTLLGGEDGSHAGFRVTGQVIQEILGAIGFADDLTILNEHGRRERLSDQLYHVTRNWERPFLEAGCHVYLTAVRVVESQILHVVVSVAYENSAYMGSFVHHGPFTIADWDSRSPEGFALPSVVTSS